MIDQPCRSRVDRGPSKSRLAIARIGVQSRAHFSRITISMINQSNGALTAAALSNSDVFARWEGDRELRSNSHGASYGSVPITTGRVFVDWFREHGRTLDPGSEEYRTAHRANVMLPNMQKAARFIELLRWHTGVVIDPTTLMVEGWRQKDYYEFWLRVIERHVRRVIFLDGWHFSHALRRRSSERR